MHTYADCIVCYLRQVLEALELNGASEETKREVIFCAAKAMRKMDFSKSPFENTGIPHSVVAKMLGIEDPYLKAKKELNRKAKEILQRLDVRAKNPFILSAVGNLLDYGPPVEKNLQRIVEMLEDERYLAKDFGSNFALLQRMLARKKQKIAFIGDNAGEIFFDAFLVAYLAEEHALTYFVKERPWINDALLNDAIEAGIDAYAQIDSVPIKNWKLGLRSKSFLSKLRKFDLIIAKGQGNYETLGEERLRCFFLLIAKCKLLAVQLKTETGKIVLASTM